MRYQRTQIYLDPEEHRRLLDEAAERGLSLAEHLRRVIGARVGEPAVPYESRSLEGIFNLLNTGPERDTVEAMDDEAAEAFEEKLRRDLEAPPPRPPRRKR